MSSYDECPGKEREANELASKIHNYWYSRGKQVDVWVEKITNHVRDASGRYFYQVRSNLFNGLPRR